MKGSDFKLTAAASTSLTSHSVISTQTSSAFKDDLCHLGQWESFPYKQWLWMKLFLKVLLYRDVWKLKSFTSTKLSSFPVDISKPFLAASLFRSWHSRTAALFFSSSVSSWDQKHSGSGHLWSSSPVHFLFHISSFKESSPYFLPTVFPTVITCWATPLGCHRFLPVCLNTFASSFSSVKQKAHFWLLFLL